MNKRERKKPGMRRQNTLYVLLVLSITLLLLIGCGSKEEESAQEQETVAQQAPEKVRAIGESMSVTGTVESVDTEAGVIVLRGPEGNLLSFTAGRQAKRLDEIDPGDLIQVDYFVTLASEIREPTDAERAEPLIVTEGAMRGPADEAPSGTAMREIKAVVEVTNIDTTALEVTIKGPRGRFVTVEVEDPTRLEGVNVGDTVMMTYREALAVAIQKEAEH
jgi:Cu/Ag efflux protein CusF